MGNILGSIWAGISGSLFGTQLRTPPGLVPSDTVVLLSPFDDTAVNRVIVLSLMFKFEDALDSEKLRSSLERLIDRDGWRKLGARLRRNANGRLEYHIPEHFSEQRPAVAYSHVKYDISISEHDLASRLPKSTDFLSIVEDPMDFQSLMRRPDGPKELDDYLYSDEPQLGLHIVPFTDATLVSVSWMHTLTDAMGRQVLFKAWSLAVQGRDDEIPEMYDVHEDPLQTLGTNPTEPYKLASLQLKGWRMFLFGLRYAYNLFRWGSEYRIVCIPGVLITKLQQSAMSKCNDDGVPFVSEGDVLCAWWARLVAIHLDPKSKRPTVITNAIGLRSRVHDLLPPSKAYIGNASTTVFTLLNVGDILREPVGYVAAAIRRSLIELGTRPQIEALGSIALPPPRKDHRPVLFGDPAMNMFVFSNWSKVGHFDLDFSAAVKQRGSADQSGSSQARQRLGKPSYVQPAMFSKLPVIQAFSILGKDALGNYWLGGMMQPKIWRKIVEHEVNGKLE